MLKTLKELLTLCTIAILTFVSASAQDSTVPQINKYYPDYVPDAPLELKHNAKAYVYFVNGSNIEYCTARIVQNGQALGTCVYRRTGTSTNVAMMDPKLDENADLGLINSGVFDLEIYEVKYKADGQDYLYSDVDSPIGKVTYRRTAQNGSVVTETGLSDRLIKSYYPADSHEGVKTYTFSKPVKPDNINAYFSYGYGDSNYTTRLNSNLSDDGLSLTIDLRGICYNVDVLAPGVTFYDDTGEVLPPPSAITLVIDNLVCTDDSRIESVSVSLDGSFSATVEGKIHQNYNYEDITFPNPAITAVEFYNSETTAQKFSAINESTDMVDINISNLAYITKADVQFSAGAFTVTVPFEEISSTSQLYKLSIPEAIRSHGADGLAISLVNVSFTIDDGAPHVIKPFIIGNQTGEARDIAELKECDENTNVILNITANGAKVTLSKAGFIFMEDTTGGIQVITQDFDTSFSTGTIVRGKLYGTYLGYGLFLVDESKSEYVAENVDVSLGLTLESIEDVLLGNFDNMLLTFSSENTSISFDEESGTGVVGNHLCFILDLVDEPAIPDEFISITGVVYFDTSTNRRILVIRSQDDIVGKTNSLGSITNNSDSSSVYSINGIKTEATTPGFYIINGKKTIIRR